MQTRLLRAVRAWAVSRLGEQTLQLNKSVCFTGGTWRCVLCQRCVMLDVGWGMDWALGQAIDRPEQLELNGRLQADSRNMTWLVQQDLPGHGLLSGQGAVRRVSSYTYWACGHIVLYVQCSGCGGP